MKKTFLMIGGFLALTAFGIGAGLVLTNIISQPEQSSNSTHESTSADHSGITNLNETKIQDLTRLTSVNISVLGGDFQPNNIQIKKGTKVTWVNDDNEAHAIKVEDNVKGSHSPIASEEVNESVLSGPKLSKGKMYEFTFNATGKTYYHCPLHPNIRGKVTVIE
jgi:plastocyanin